MKLSHILSLFIICFGLNSFGQKSLFYQTMDSIQIGYRSIGTELDSLDASFIGDINLRPGGGFSQVYEHHLADNLFSSYGGFSYLANPRKVKPKFTGLPYLGFQYAFGSSLTQDLNLEYHHFLQESTQIHFRYNRRTSNGFLRNSAYKLNDLSLMFHHVKGRYSTNVDAFYGAHQLGQSGGIKTDIYIENQGLEFTPVYKDEAESVIRNLDLKWDNYYRLIGDSIVGSGIKTKHQYTLLRREFTEKLSDLSSIDTFYIDTNGITRDQYQTVHFSNGAGVYFSSPNFQVDATLNYQYWRNQNLGRNRDTSEVFIHSNLYASLGTRINVHNEFYFNLIGATGEIKDKAKLEFHILKNLSLIGGLNFENLYPTPYQRFHTANYYQWEIEDLKMQQKLQVKGGLRFGQKNFVAASVNWTSINNGRYFIENEWRQDTLDFVSVGALTINGGLTLGKWGIYPSATLRFNSANFSFQPLFSTMNRFSFTTQLFEAQRLGISLGADVGYETGYQFMLYNEVLDVFQPTQTVLQTEAMLKLNAFLALSIDEFRFFVRAENLSSLINDPKTRIDLNYPIMPLIIRLGVTWDFFN